MSLKKIQLKCCLVCSLLSVQPYSSFLRSRQGQVWRLHERTANTQTDTRKREASSKSYVAAGRKSKVHVRNLLLRKRERKGEQRERERERDWEREREREIERERENSNVAFFLCKCTHVLQYYSTHLSLFPALAVNWLYARTSFSLGPVKRRSAARFAGANFSLALFPRERERNRTCVRSVPVQLREVNQLIHKGRVHSKEAEVWLKVLISY